MFITSKQNINLGLVYKRILESRFLEMRPPPKSMKNCFDAVADRTINTQPVPVLITLLCTPDFYGDSLFFNTHAHGNFYYLYFF